MTDTWYYTLSTISQTLAAILGLAAVFVTLRLQGITEKLKDYKKRAFYIVRKRDEHINPPVKIAKIFERSASGLFKDLQDIEKNYIEKYDLNSGMKSDIAALARIFEPNVNFNNMGFLSDTADNLFIYINERKELINSIRLPGIVTASSIIYTILILSITDLLFSVSKCLALSLFVLAIIGSILSIVLISKSCWKLLKATGEKI